MVNINTDQQSPVSLQDVLDHLEDVTERGEEYRAPCPAHDGKTMDSLSVKLGDNGKPVVYCHSQGCSYQEVLTALGLWNDAPHQPSGNGAAKSKAKSKGKGEKKTGRQPSATWEIRDRSNKHWADHVRYDNPEDPDDKECRWRRPGVEWGLGGTKLQDLPLYGSELVDSWPPEQVVIVVEGEKAKDAAHKAGLNALGTVTGANSTPGPEALEVARDRRVVLWPDNDDPGRAHMHRIGEALQGVAAKVLWFEWEDAPPKGDAADHPAIVDDDPEGLAELKRRLFEAAAWTQPPSREEEAWADPEPLKEELPPVEELHAKLIPGPLRGWIFDVAARMDNAPPDFAAAAAVVEAGSLLGRKVGMRPKRHDDWTVVPNV